MYPVNQVILGGDPILNGLDDIDMQIQKMEAYRKRLQQLKASQNQPVQRPSLIWDSIDAEVNPLTDEQKNMLLRDEDYVDTYNKIQNLVQAELLNLVKEKIENTQEGKELLQRHLKTVKKLKGKIVSETNREMETFRKFREFSKMNPGVTYEDFVKANM